MSNRYAVTVNGERYTTNASSPRIALNRVLSLMERQKRPVVRMPKGGRLRTMRVIFEILS